ncbi:MAG: HpcH/HpaI aldolase/citrate lyase family protein [Streptosporangiaceae bacterium]
MTAPSRAWAMLFIPGTADDKLGKIGRFGSPPVILDLEDSVPPDQKEESRQRAAALIDAEGPRQRLHVRVNPAGSSLQEADLSAVVRPGLSGVVVPKVERATDLRAVVERIDTLERAAGMSPGQVAVMATIETAAGVHAVDDIAAVGGRLRRLCFGAGDFALDLGLDAPDEDGAPETVVFAKIRLVMASRVAGIEPPHDSVYPRYRDLGGLRAEARQARRLGFAGKHVIHPSQIPVVDEVFRPTAAQLARARRLVAALEEAERSGRGAVGVDGELVDYPILYRARRLLQEAGE